MWVHLVETSAKTITHHTCPVGGHPPLAIATECKRTRKPRGANSVNSHLQCSRDKHHQNSDVTKLKKVTAPTLLFTSNVGNATKH